MRLIFLAAALTLALAACGKNNQVGQNQNADENMSAESIVANDVTAIDAVTGDAANMAADVNYEEFANEAGADNATEATPEPRARRAAASAPANAAENTTTNGL